MSQQQLPPSQSGQGGTPIEYETGGTGIEESQPPTGQMGQQGQTGRMSQQGQTGQMSQQGQTGQMSQQGQMGQAGIQQGEAGMAGERIQPAQGRLDDALTGEMRLALHDFVQAATVCEWCADRCLDEGPGMSECIRLCRDVADLATLNVQFMTRDSTFGQDVAETFARAAEECANECARHQHPHCQECASVLTRAVNSTWTMLESFERQQAAAGQQQATPGY